MPIKPNDFLHVSQHEKVGKLCSEAISPNLVQWHIDPWFPSSCVWFGRSRVGSSYLAFCKAAKVILTWFGNSALRAKKFWRFHLLKLKIAEADVAGPNPEHAVDLKPCFFWKYGGRFPMRQNWRRVWVHLFTFGWNPWVFWLLLSSFRVLNVILLKYTW